MVRLIPILGIFFLISPKNYADVIVGQLAGDGVIIEMGEVVAGALTLCIQLRSDISREEQFSFPDFATW
jgi:hypothetical protein